MTDESVKTTEPIKDASAVAEAATSKSTIQFPYLDLDNAIAVVKAVRSVEGDRCEWNQLAIKLGVAANGGGFRMRLLAAKTYGLLTYDRGIVQLTELGMRAADPLREKRARFDAFMSAGLYKQLFDRLNGQTLPPVAAIELMMERLGVSAKLKEKARQVFMRAAKNAGLLELSNDRLSTPPGLDAAPRQNDTPQQEEQKIRAAAVMMERRRYTRLSMACFAHCQSQKPTGLQMRA